MQEHRQFNMDQTHLLTPVPLFTLDCEMGTVKVLESDNDSVGGNLLGKQGDHHSENRMAAASS